MDELIRLLEAHRNNSNNGPIDELIELIEDEKIDSLMQLKTFENELSNTVIRNYLEEIDANPFEYEGLLYDEIQELKRLRKLISDGDETEQKRLLVKYCILTNRTTPFPAVTYEMISNDEI